MARKSRLNILTFEKDAKSPINDTYLELVKILLAIETWYRMRNILTIFALDRKK